MLWMHWVAHSGLGNWFLSTENLRFELFLKEFFTDLKPLFMPNSECLSQVIAPPFMIKLVPVTQRLASASR